MSTPLRRWFLICFAALCPLGAGGQSSTRAAGAAVFASSGCVHCHGASGLGTDSGPSLREVHRKLKAAQIERQIVQGGGEMPAFGSSLSAEQVGQLVAFLRARTWVEAPAPTQP